MGDDVALLWRHRVITHYVSMAVEIRARQTDLHNLCGSPLRGRRCRARAQAGWARAGSVYSKSFALVWSLSLSRDVGTWMLQRRRSEHGSLFIPTYHVRRV